MSVAFDDSSLFDSEANPTHSLYSFVMYIACSCYGLLKITMKVCGLIHVLGEKKSENRPKIVLY